jgi:hypothetical protein
VAEFIVSPHAIDRALDMALDPADIRETILRPRERYYSARTNSELRTRGKITACVRDDNGLQIVTTFMWAKPSGWAADAEYGTYDGRDNNNLDGVRRVRRAKKRNRR